MRVTNAYLARAYAEFNRKYFRNRLPHDMVVRFAADEGCGTTYFQYGRPLYIILNKRLAWHNMLADMTLLHEMVHVELDKFRASCGRCGHRFNRRMKKLAQTGAFNGLW